MPGGKLAAASLKVFFGLDPNSNLLNQLVRSG